MPVGPRGRAVLAPWLDAPASGPTTSCSARPGRWPPTLALRPAAGQPGGSAWPCTTGAANKVWTEAELKRAFLGRSRREVINVLGPTNEVGGDMGNGIESWSYTLNAADGKRT